MVVCGCLLVVCGCLLVVCGLCGDLWSLSILVTTTCVFTKTDSVRKDLSINSDAIDSLSIKIRNRKTRKVISNIVYRPPNGDIKISEQFCKDLLSEKVKHDCCRLFHH